MGVAARSGTDPLTEGFVRELHRRMFGRTWDWADTFRSSGKSIGVDWRQVGVQLRDLLDDARYWLARDTMRSTRSPRDSTIASSAFIPFPNGNGRRARLMADVLLVRRGAESFSWGRGDLVDAGAARDRYIAALKAADRGEVGPLLEFVRS